MTQLQVFKNELFEVGAKVENETILFDADQVARCLGITEFKGSKEYVMWRRVNKYLFGTSAENDNSPEVGKGSLIPEPLVYKLAFKASNEVAEQFQDWLAVEVIPSIRKHGAYITTDVLEQAVENPDFMIGLFEQIKKERAEKELIKKENTKLNTEKLVLEQQVNELQPKASYYDLILQNKSLISISQIAKDYGMGAPTMNKLLHKLGVQYKQGEIWLLYAKYQDKGYTQTYMHAIDSERSKPHTKWTQKGRLFIYELLKSEGIVPMIERNFEKVN